FVKRERMSDILITQISATVCGTQPMQSQTFSHGSCLTGNPTFISILTIPIFAEPPGRVPGWSCQRVFLPINGSGMERLFQVPQATHLWRHSLESTGRGLAEN